MSNGDELGGKTLVIGIGAQKSGTSWLYSYLNKHPQVLMSRVKELHYFDSQYRPDISGSYEERFRIMLSEFLRDADWSDPRRGQNMVRARALLDRMALGAGEITYLDFFAKRVGPRHRAFGEVTPSYAILDTAALQAMRDLHDNVRVVYIMRDPIERLWSAFRHSGITADDDAAALEAQMARPHHALRSDYAHTVRAVDGAFSAGDALYLFYETLFTEATVHEICAFVGIDYVPADFELRVNVGKEVAMPAIFRDLAGGWLHDTYEFCHERFGAAVPSSWSL